VAELVVTWPKSDARGFEPGGTREEFIADMSVSADQMGSWHRKEWLSFNPLTLADYEEKERFEVIFIRGLTRSGLSDAMINGMLSSLEKPYCYDPSKPFFPFVENRWISLPEQDPADVTNKYVDELVETQDWDALRELRKKISQALENAGATDEIINAKYGDYVRRVIEDIKGLPDNCRQSGDDGLTDVWEEFKAQIQGQESFSFSAYEETARQFIAVLLKDLQAREKKVLWHDAEGRWEYDEDAHVHPDQMQADVGDEIYRRLCDVAANDGLSRLKTTVPACWISKSLAKTWGPSKLQTGSSAGISSAAL